MALTFINLLQPELRYTFDDEQMLYTVDMSFLAEFPEEDDGTGTMVINKDLADVLETAAAGAYVPSEWEEGATKAAIPATVEIEYPGATIDASTAPTTTICYLADLDVTNTTNEAQVRANATYLGRVQGTHTVTPRTQMQSVRQPHSLDTDAEGDRIGIGPDFEGVARHMPLSIMQVKEVVGFATGDARSDSVWRVAGSVNELNWTAPWGTTYPEGSWVYMGIVASAHDRRSRTVELIHEFTRQGDRELQQDHRWFRYKRTEDADGRIKLKYDATPTTAQFLPIAGTDQWFDSGTIIGGWSSQLPLYTVWE